MDDDLGWSAVSAEQACPVCGSRTGCGTAPFRGGVAIACRWTVSSTPMSDGGWLHRLSAAEVADASAYKIEGAACAFPKAEARDADPQVEPGPAAPMETVLGAFGTRRLAQSAAADLLIAGFLPAQLSAVGRHDARTDPPADEGGVVGTMGEFGTMAVGMISAAIPGIGPVVALGPFSLALAAALRGDRVGGLAGLFTVHGVPDHDAARYAARVGAGEYVVAVHTDDGALAEATLTASGAEAPVRHVRGGTGGPDTAGQSIGAVV
jgi:hypothetical protein